MKVLNTRGVQELLQISQSEAYRLLREEGCPLLKLGGKKYRIVDEDLINWLRKKEA